MCYLGVLPRKSGLSNDLLQNAYDHNSDGWGIMYAREGRVISIKEKSGMKRFFQAWERVPEDCHVAVHFRFGTSGPKNSKSCHPFPILEKAKGDPIDLFLMHNGVLRHYNGTNQASDTMQYCESLASQLRRCPELLKDRYWREAQEHLLGNPNKVVLLEGNGRWHYFNYNQGERDKDTGVWHSNLYSLRPVYSGHGKGKAACDTRACGVYQGDDWSDYGGYYGAASRNDAGNLLTEQYKAAVGPLEKSWAMSFHWNNKEREQVYWKRAVFGWLRYAKNPSTGAFYRDYKRDGEKAGADICTVLPPDHIKFTPKNETAWERGDRHNIELVNGEYTATPIAPVQATLYSTSEASAATTGAATKPAATFPEPENAANAGPSITEVLARLDAQETVRLSRVICGDSGQPCDLACDQGQGCAVTRTALAVTEAREEEEESREAAMEDREEEYLAQLFSSENLRTMTEEELQQAIYDYPEEAAIALGRAHNARWAWEDVS